MAEESTHLPVTPKNTGHKAGKLRMNSTGKLSSPKIGQNVLPNYLRASTGSCHDFCKYGRQHSSEKKARHSVQKKMTPSLSDRQTSVGVIVSEERKKSSMTKQKHSPVSKNQLSDTPEIVKQEVLFSSKKSEAPEQHSSSNKKKTENENRLNLPATQTLSVKPKPVKVKPSSTSNVSSGLVCRQDGGIKSGRKTGTPKVAVKSIMGSPAAPFPPKHSPNKVVGLYSKKFRSLGLASPLTDQNRMRKAQSKQPGSGKVQAKTIRVVEAETGNHDLGSVEGGSVIQLPPSPLLSKDSNSEKAQERTLHVVAETENQNVVSLLTGSVVQLSSSPSLSMKFDTEKVHERTLHVVEAETENQSVDCVQNFSAPQMPSSSSFLSPELSSPSLSFNEDEGLEEPECTESEADEFMYENEENINMDEIEVSGGSLNMTLKRHGMISSEDNDSEAVKLKFRRGKIVDLRPENNGPRRLRFRKGRLLVKDNGGKGDTRKKSFVKKTVDDKEVASPDSEKVVLRHQDAEEKKDAQGLFNNVIEETASKLVETRKSKVQALVGAFETVISLQEIKPSSTQDSPSK